MAFYLYNTLNRKTEELVPIRPGSVGLYCCGPTVYDYAHIGNLRTYVFEDLLRRALERAGYAVHHVMNITDVGHLSDDGDEGEDKMQIGARRQGKSVWDIAKHYTDAFFQDTAKLNILPPHDAPRATEHIAEMQALIHRLQDKGLTYQSGGNVYFDIEKFPRYGELALLEQADLKAGARIAVDEAKKNPNDFVLWFTQGKFENQTMQWDSPWGRGYPGWHLECSAMSMKYLGEEFDIHCGGVDHINVHHTNEIAQSEGATGKRWVHYWMHGEFLVMKQGRMGKSVGNSVTLTTLEDSGFDPLDYRYYLLGAHYRTQMAFSFQALEAAKSARASLLATLQSLARRAGATPGDRGGEGLAHPLSELGSEAAAGQKAIDAAFADDLNVPKALGVLRSLLKSETIAPAERLAVALDSDRVFGLRLRETLTAVDAKAAARDADDDLPSHLLEMIRQREAARTRRDFATADALRDELAANGITIKDTPQGTVWSH